jgi:acyl-CoA thioesterase-1
MGRRASVVATVTFVCLGGCKRGDGPHPPSEAAPAANAPHAAATAATAATADVAKGPRVVFFGDSLTAGMGVDGDQAFPAIVGRDLAAEGLEVRVVNAGVSGDTTTDGMSRLSWILSQKPDVVVVGLGANDGLRGLDLALTENNLRQIIARARATGADIVLLGMQMPPSLGPEYEDRFKALFPRLARELEVPLVPFLLDGVGGVPALNQADGIHPTVEGQRILANNVLPALRTVVRARIAKTNGSR